jgi:hypothetical protein
MMRPMTRRALALALLTLGGALTLAACKENDAATVVCQEEAKTSAECRDCCHRNGAFGHQHFGEVCVCRG